MVTSSNNPANSPARHWYALALQEYFYSLPNVYGAMLSHLVVLHVCLRELILALELSKASVLRYEL